LRGVSFLIVGAQKAGTSALAEFLSAHPALHLPERKELHFFDHDPHFDGADRADYAPYHEHFAGADADLLWGEATPIYMYWLPAAARIRAYQPGMKLIFLLRHPVERAYSQWQMEYELGRDRWSFSTAIRLEWLRLVRSPRRQHRLYSYVDRGAYASQIRRMLRHFPREQMLFLRTKDLRERHEETLVHVHRFLGVDPVAQPRRAVNARHYAPMREADRRHLLRRFAKEVDELERLLGWDCSAWRT
jgi:hypothetical protein